MKVEYSYKDGRCEATISDNSDWQLFNGVADAILRNFNGTLVESVDGLEERYWDIEIATEIVTLHLQHYLGIVLFSQDQGTNDLIGEIGTFLETIEPKKMFRNGST